MERRISLDYSVAALTGRITGLARPSVRLSRTRKQRRVKKSWYELSPGQQ